MDGKGGPRLLVTETEVRSLVLEMRKGNSQVSEEERNLNRSLRGENSMSYRCQLRERNYPQLREFLAKERRSSKSVSNL